jgi:hypothetical protein
MASVCSQTSRLPWSLPCPQPRPSGLTVMRSVSDHLAFLAASLALVRSSLNVVLESISATADPGYIHTSAARSKTSRFFFIRRLQYIEGYGCASPTYGSTGSSSCENFERTRAVTGVAVTIAADDDPVSPGHCRMAR